MTLRRILRTAGIAVGLIAVGMGSASAGAFTHSTTGVSINGTYEFQPQSVSQGAFRFYGTLTDTNTSDGNAGKQQVRVSGYGYNTYYAPVDKNIYLDKSLYDGAALQVNTARAKVCRDRGALLPDNCSTEKTYTR